MIMIIIMMMIMITIMMMIIIQVLEKLTCDRF